MLLLLVCLVAAVRDYYVIHGTQPAYCSSVINRYLGGASVRSQALITSPVIISYLGLISNEIGFQQALVSRLFDNWVWWISFLQGINLQQLLPWYNQHIRQYSGSFLYYWWWSLFSPSFQRMKKKALLTFVFHFHVVNSKRSSRRVPVFAQDCPSYLLTANTVCFCFLNKLWQQLKTFSCFPKYGKCGTWPRAARLILILGWIFVAFVSRSDDAEIHTSFYCIWINQYYTSCFEKQGANGSSWFIATGGNRWIICELSFW